MSNFPHLNFGDVYVRYDTPWEGLFYVTLSESPEGGRYAKVPTFEGPLGPTFDFEHFDEAPNPAEVFLHRRGDTAQEAERKLVRLHTSRLLAASTKRLLPAAVVVEVAKRTRLGRRTVEGWLRLDTGRNHYVIRKSEKDERFYLTMGDSLRNAERARAYSAAFAQELAVQARDIGLLIQHPGTKGSYREDLLRHLIQRHIPTRFHAATGFIFGRSEQLDILIYDQVDYAPLFRQGDLVVVPEAAVRAVIEVKSNLTAPHLRAALRHLSDAVPANHGQPPIFKGVFGYRGGGNPALRNTVTSFYGEGDDKTTLDDIGSMENFYSPVHAVCVLEKSLMMVDFAESQTIAGRIVPIAHSPINAMGRNAQAALFFDRMTRFLRSPFSGPLIDATRAKLVMEEIIYDQPAEIRNDEWGPYAVIKEDPSGATDLREQIEAFGRWEVGQPWMLNA